MDERKSLAALSWSLVLVLVELLDGLCCIFELGKEDDSTVDSCGTDLLALDWWLPDCLEVLLGVPSESTSLELDKVEDAEDKGPDEEFEECLLRHVSEVLLLGWLITAHSSETLLLHLSSCGPTSKVTSLPFNEESPLFCDPQCSCIQVL